LKKAFAPAAILLAAAAILVNLSIRGLGTLVGAFGAKELVPVFEQLRHAQIIPGLFLGMIPAVLFAWLFVLVKPTAGKIALAVCGLFSTWLAALWSASVNSIVFGDILSSLFRLIRAGALELL